MDIVPIKAATREEQYEPIKLKVKDPGKVRAVMTVLLPPETNLLVADASAGKVQAQGPRPVPAIVFEIDPEGEERQRHYLWLAPGIKITYPGNLEFRGTYVDETSLDMMFLYEAFPDKKG